MNKEYMDKNIKIDKELSFALVFQIVIVSLKNSLTHGIPMLMNYNLQLNLTLLILIGIVYLRTLLKVSRNMKMNIYSLFVIFTVGITWLIGIVREPDSIKYVSETLIRFIPYGLMSFIILSAMKEHEYLMEYFDKTKYIMIIGSLISGFSLLLNASTTSYQYVMPLSYTTILPTLLLMLSAFKKKKIKDIFLAMLGLLLIIMFGSRTPMLLTLLFGVILMITSRLTIKKVGIIVSSIVLLILIFINFDETILFLIKVLEKFNIQSRTLLLLLNNNISNLTGRDNLYTILFEALNQNPILGVGAGKIKVLMQGGSPHSLLLDFLFTFGYVIGPIFILIITYVLFRTYFLIRKKEDSTKYLFLLFFTLSIPRGILGGSIWGTEEFWWLIGLAVSTLHTRKILKCSNFKD